MVAEWKDIDALALKLFVWAENADRDVWSASDEAERNYWRGLARIALEHRLER